MIDHIERRIRKAEILHRKIEHNQVPTLPIYDLSVSLGLTYSAPVLTYRSKNHAAWWNLDDTFNGISAGFGSAGDVWWLGKWDGSFWNYYAGPGIVGVYLQTSPAPGTPYFPSGPVPVGGVGNGFTPIQNDTNSSLNSGDQLAVIGYVNSVDGTPSWESDPYLEVDVTLYDTDGTTVLHSWGVLHIPVKSYPLPPVGGFYIYPMAPGDTYVSSIFTMP